LNKTNPLLISRNFHLPFTLQTFSTSNERFFWIKLQMFNFFQMFSKVSQIWYMKIDIYYYSNRKI
jgi:hypothetical protein